MPTTTGSIHMYWDDLLTNPRAHQDALANILAQAPVPKARVGYKPRDFR